MTAVENLQEVHSEILKTNEEVIRFNSDIISLSVDLLADENLNFDGDQDDNYMNTQLDKLEKQCKKSRRDCEKLTKKVDQIFKQNLNLNKQS